MLSSPNGLNALFTDRLNEQDYRFNKMSEQQKRDKEESTRESVFNMMERMKLRQRIDPFKYAKKLGIDLII